MHEILVISGKGGTGKTSLTAAFAHLAQSHVICDLDVDAPDLHLLLQPTQVSRQAFYAGHTARIREDRCTACGECLARCRFDAVRPGDPVPAIDPLRCEGCKVCVAFCPAEAIAFETKHCGTWFQSATRFGPMIHAQLFPAEENSGRLVALLRQQAREQAQAAGLDLILSDGPPGIGCPVISALAGVHLAVVVTEPTPSGHHDLERILDLCDHFNVPAVVIINKCDLSDAYRAQIHQACRRRKLPVVAEIPHDQIFVQAVIEGRTVTECGDGLQVQPIYQAWEAIRAHALAAERRAGSRGAAAVGIQPSVKVG